MSTLISMRRMAAAAVAGMVAAGVAAACSSGPTACPDIVSMVLMPRDTSMLVGQQFQARLAIGGTCTRTGLTRATWASSNPQIATVNPTTGLVTALATGDVRIAASKHDATRGDVGFGAITVHVRAPAPTP